MTESTVCNFEWIEKVKNKYMPQTLFIMPFFKKTPPYDYYQENLFSHVLIIKFGEK